MFAKLVAVIAENRQLIEFATGNALFVLSAVALIAVGGWVMLMRRKNHRM